ncbi:S46 family peptidase [Mangrovibacterium diazotrophicum]|uniref:Dipeptidyl-peptidase n=1 Tax=Mangrovibacterium diazotrophicum TaxID=1261403 RepID=A0A419VVW1_9BACT|nr:S46 family peptidase [Mangrovibacterium diazotrophicum]RKD86304.1 peptidase S46-like protein [Mangrovibacterium diazotrophicum]
MVKIKLLFLGVLLHLALLVSANEGMWIPTLLKKYNIEEMQQMGFRLTADDIYSINHNSLKDAVVLFGGGCTGELVSAEGLLLTNHHCGYRQIQSHSSVEHDYLTDGFWAKSREEELTNPGLTVRFLDRMEDVTEKVMEGTDSLTGEDMEKKITRNIYEIKKEAKVDERYAADVKPIFKGNQYFLYVYKVYRDVRLVGAPPSAIGKFGGDTDNWMWPRHTGDFSIFRVYADKNNEPADYSPDNVPYTPKKFFPISMKGVQPEDFVMIFGFPGSTDEYLPSFAVELLMQQSDPDKIKIRTTKLDILRGQMEADPKVRIQYASKYASTSNSWKRWQGEIRGLKRMDALGIKNEFEGEFKNWYGQSEELSAKYESLLPDFERLYVELTPFDRAKNYYDEVVKRGTDIFQLAQNTPRNVSAWNKSDAETQQKVKDEILKRIEAHFKDYDQATDEHVFTALLRMYKADLDPSFLPKEFSELLSKYDDEKLLKKVYRKSILTDKAKFTDLVRNLDEKAIERLQKDPIVALYDQLAGYYQANVERPYSQINDEIDKLQKTYMAGIMAMKEGQALYPDANLTLRVAYGKVEGYKPRDGVEYNYFTTVKGIMEKDNPDIYDYDVPQRLRDLYAAKDFGRYAEDRQMHVAFTASIHTTGGNSGSPAINANGELIGINFDRCWEGTMSDIMFDPDQCRNIMVDIRYVLFIIDKFAGAGYLLDEMQLVPAEQAVETNTDSI